MNDLIEIANAWPVRTLLGGGLVLLIGRLATSAFRQPSRRAIVGVSAVAASLLIVPLTLLPAWAPISVANRGQQTISEESAAGPAPVVLEAAAVPKWELAVWRPEFQEAKPLPVPVVDAPAKAAIQPVAVAPAPAIVNVEPSEPIALTATSSAWTMGDVMRIVAIAYIAIAGLMLVRLAIGQLTLRRIWNRSHPVPDWAEQVFRLLAADRRPNAKLRMACRRTGPVCFGVFQPRVLVPASIVASGDGPALRCILAHELGHLSRRDPLSGWLWGIAQTMYFVFPWLYTLRREIRVAQECLADADAVSLAEAPVDYAELLIRLTRTRPSPIGAPAARGSNSELFRRITMLLKRTNDVERRCPRRWLVAAAGGLTSLAIVAGGMTFQIRTADAAEPEKKEVPKPEPKADAKPKKDGLKDALEKLKKDLGDDPAAAKQVEEMLKAIEEGRPAPLAVPLIPPIRNPNPAIDPFVQDLDKLQEELQRHMQQMLGQMRGGGVGVMMRPAGMAGFPGAVGQGRLGVRVERPGDALVSQLDLPNGKGLLITDVPADSNAGKIGIKPHDIILEVAGKGVSNQVNEFVQDLKSVKETDAVDIVLLRKGKKETLKGVKIPAAKEAAFEGAFPALPPLPNFNPNPVLPGGGVPAAPVVPQPVPLGNGESARVEQVNDAFTIFYAKNGVKVTVTGAKDADGKAKAESIEVEEGGKVTKAESIDKLPKEYQELAKKALGVVK